MFKDSKLSCTFVHRIVLHRVIKFEMKNSSSKIFNIDDDEKLVAL